DMGVDQPGHQRAPGELDRLRPGADDRPVGDLADAAVLDQHVMVLAAAVLSPVEHRAIGEYDPGHRCPRSPVPGELTPAQPPVPTPAPANRRLGAGAAKNRVANPLSGPLWQKKFTCCVCATGLPTTLFLGLEQLGDLVAAEVIGLEIGELRQALQVLD